MNNATIYWNPKYSTNDTTISPKILNIGLMTSITTTVGTIGMTIHAAQMRSFTVFRFINYHLLEAHRSTSVIPVA
jgi:hypothetical protein